MIIDRSDRIEINRRTNSFGNLDIRASDDDVMIRCADIRITMPDMKVSVSGASDLQFVQVSVSGVAVGCPPGSDPSQLDGAP